MVTAHFKDIAQHIRKELATARHSIKLAMAWLTERGLLAELAAAAQRGVSVEIVVSGHRFNQMHLLMELADSGVQILQHPAIETNQTGFVHHKFCIIDYSTVLTGSFNWSKNAGRNAENIAITHDDERLADSYLQEFQRLFATAQPLQLADSRSWRPLILQNIWGRNLAFSNSEETQSDIGLVRFWATRLLGAPGQETTLHWQAPIGWAVRLSLLPEADDLKTRGSFSTTFSDNPIDVVLRATNPNDGAEIERIVRIQSAHVPNIELLALDRPTIVGRVMPAQLRWRVSRAESVYLEPGHIELPHEGERTVSPAASTTYTLTATGLGGTRQRSVSVGVFPMPVLGHLKVPVPSGMRIEAQLTYAATPIPSGLDLRGSRFPFTTPSLRGLRSKLLQPALTLAQLAATRGMDSPADLRLPPRLTETPLSGWTRWKHDLLLKMEQRYANNHRLVHILSTIRHHYA